MDSDDSDDDDLQDEDMIQYQHAWETVCMKPNPLSIPPGVTTVPVEFGVLHISEKVWLSSCGKYYLYCSRLEHRLVQNRNNDVEAAIKNN